jgi:outer membrane protein, multidrug efflux system
MALRSSLLALSALSILGACAQTPKPEVSAGPLPETWREAIPATPATDAAAWWAAFADPTLDKLVREALTENISVQQAALRITQSRSQARAAIAGFAPRLSAEGNAAAQSKSSEGSPPSSDAFGTGSAGLGASWEVPLFGRLDATIIGARALEDGTKADLEAARVALVADLADAYINLRVAQTQLLIQQETAARFERIAAIAKERGAAGLVSPTDVASAQASAADARRSLPDAQLAVSSSLDRIAILRGKAPGTADAELSTPTPLSFVAPPVTSAPADLLRRRPDIRSAEAQTVQAAAAVGVARADLYPRVSIRGALSAATSMFGPDFASTRPGSASAAISLPLFDYGQRMAAVDQRDAELKIALLAYQAAALRAIAEGQSALASYSEGTKRLSAAVDGEAASQKSATGTSRAYESGLVSMRERLQAETAFSQSRLATLGAQRELASASVALYRAFAGSPPV